MADSPAIDPALLDRLRRGFPLRLDRMGEFWIADDKVTHPRVQDVLHAGLDVSEAGEPTMHLGDQWCYLTVDDCYFRVIRVRPADDGGLLLQLDDGRGVPLDPATLWEEPDQGLRCAVPARRSGRPLSARFTNLAQIELAERMDLEAEPRPELVLGDHRWPIPESAP